MGFFSIFKSRKEESAAPKAQPEPVISVPKQKEPTEQPVVHLTALEKNFLKYMDRKDAVHPYIADYWKFEYNLKPEELIPLFLEKKLLLVSDPSYHLQQFSSKELKAVLKKFNLSQTGNKKELTQRILTHLSESELASCSNLKPIYYLTESGKNLVASLPVSATKDPDFEDQCIYSILRQDFGTAYQMICQRELHKNIPRRDTLNWKDKMEKGLSQESLYKISYFFTSPLPLEVAEPIEALAQEVKACTIFGYLFPLTAAETAAVMARRTGLDSKEMHLNVLSQKLISYLA